MDENNYELIPPEGHPDAGVRVFSILDEILADKEAIGLPKKLNYYYKLSRNKHWKSKTSNPNLATINLLHKNRQSKVNQLTDNHPIFEIAKVGAQEGNERVYDTLLRIIQHWWHDQEQQHIYRKSVLDGETNGFVIEKMIFNEEINKPVGEAETIIVDPFNFGFYPVDITNQDDAEAMLQYDLWTVRKARRIWPEHAKKIKADKSLLEGYLAEERREIQSDSSSGVARSWLTTIGNVVKHMRGNSLGHDGAAVDQKCLIVECWVKDYTKLETGEYKYAGNIRRLTVCNAGELVLEDRDNPSINPALDKLTAQKTYLWDRFPYSITQSLTDNVSLWGASDFDQLASLNIELNKKISQYNLFVDKAARLKVINPKDSGVQNSQIDNYPGVLNPSNRLVAAGIRYLDNPKNPLDIERAIAIYQEAFFQVANSFDMDLVRKGGNSVIAYKAIAALLEIAQTMLKDKLGNYSKMLRIRGRMYISTVQNWYTHEMEIPYEEDGEQVVEKVRGSDLILKPAITVVSGSTMPISRVQKREEAIDLWKGHAIPLDELLKALDWPDRKKVVRKMQEGPFGQILQMLAQTGAPPQFLQFMQALFRTDPKDFQKALKAQEIPPFAQIAQPQQELGQGLDPAQQMESVMNQAEAQLKMAQTEKVNAETDKIAADIALVEEKTVTERILQMVKVTGVTFDEETLKLKRAEFVADMEKEKEKILTDRAKIFGDIEKETVKHAEQRGQGPYREKGLASNNEDLRRIS